MSSISCPRPLLLVAALLFAACSSSPPANHPPAGGEGGAGGDEGGAGGGGGPTMGQGSGGAAGAPVADAAPPVAQDATIPPPDAGAPADTAPTGEGGSGGGGGGGVALLVVGAIPLIGDDVQINKELLARGLKVEPALDSKVTVADTMGKQLVVLSYSLDSKRNFHQNFADVPVPIIVMEHGLLASLGMANMHRWAEPAQAITIMAADSPLAAGFPAGDVTIYGKSGEMFWGVPSNDAIKVAIAKGKPDWWVIFAYDKGKMMISKPAPARRLQFFMGAHLVPDMFMNANGLKLLDAAIDWCVK